MIMTNHPLQGDDLQCTIAWTPGGLLVFKVSSNSDPGRGLYILRSGYVNPQLLLDLPNVEIRLIQMSDIKDFRSLLDISYQKMHQVMKDRGLAHYKKVLNDAGHNKLPKTGHLSGIFQGLIYEGLNCGRLNHPMIQIMNPSKSMFHVIPENLKTVCTADQSRIHQLPLPIGRISSRKLTVLGVNEDYYTLAEMRLDKIDNLLKRFWPKGVSPRSDKDTVRTDKLGYGYAWKIF